MIIKNECKKEVCICGQKSQINDTCQYQNTSLYTSEEIIYINAGMN